MIRFKRQGIIIVLLFVLLIAIAAAPLMLLEYKNARLMNTPKTTAISVETAIDEPVIPKDYDALERIWTAKKSMEESKDVIVNWQQWSMSADKQKELVQTVEDQIVVIQNLKALPLFTFSEEYQVTASKWTYMDMKNPNDFVNTWNIRVDYPDILVSAYMDMETFIIYDILIVPKTTTIEYDKNIISADGFLEYLQIESKNVEKYGERFEANGIYTPDVIRLSVVSYNKDTQAVTSYRFDESTDNMTLMEPGTSAAY